MEKVEIINSIIKFWHYYQKEPEKKKNYYVKLNAAPTKRVDLMNPRLIRGLWYWNAGELANQSKPWTYQQCELRLSRIALNTLAWAQACAFLVITRRQQKSYSKYSHIRIHTAKEICTCLAPYDQWMINTETCYTITVQTYQNMWCCSLTVCAVRSLTLAHRWKLQVKTISFFPFDHAIPMMWIFRWCCCFFASCLR